MVDDSGVDYPDCMEKMHKAEMEIKNW